MQGRTFDKPQTLMATIHLADFIPRDHLRVRVDQVIDWTFIYDRVKPHYCQDNGRPSIDPVIYFKMQLIGYFYGIASDRQLCRDSHLNLAYCWFCRFGLTGKVPHHTSMTRIRDRLWEATFRTIFETLLRRWQAANRLTGRRLLVDASLVEANAAYGSLVERQDEDPKKRPLKPYQQRYREIKRAKAQRRRVSNQTHVSRSDADATLVSRPGYFKRLYYKVHYTIDADSRLITDCLATTGSRHECPLLPERIAYQLNQFHFPVVEITADKGYGRGPTYTYLRSQRIRAYIPLHDDNSGQGQISRGEFDYERRYDRYRCPQGHYLLPYETLDHGLVKRYRLVGGHCRQCPQRTQCLPEKHKHRARFVYRSPHQDEIDRIRIRQKTVRFKTKLIERHWKLEGLFGDAKTQHNLRMGRDSDEISQYRD